MLAACTPNEDKLVQSSRELTKQLATDLKSRLKSTLQSSGPIAAISVCNIDAVKITNNVSSSFEGEIGRTSLKLRSLANKPDDWEETVLLKFEQLKDSGTPLNELEIYETVKVANKKVFRYMKAIPASEPCLMCHGKNIAAPIKEKIQALYPQDEATGFSVGDVRGAFTIKHYL